MWTSTHQLGVQLHDLRDAVCVWANRYGQRAWLRQLDPPADAEMEKAVLRTVARLDGTPFPSTAQLAWRWLRGRVPAVRLPALPGRALPDARVGGKRLFHLRPGQPPTGDVGCGQQRGQIRIRPPGDDLAGPPGHGAAGRQLGLGLRGGERVELLDPAHRLPPVGPQGSQTAGPPWRPAPR